jgi:uncharacterized protein
MDEPPSSFPPGSEQDPGPFTWADALIWCFGALLTMVLSIGLLSAMSPGSERDLVSLGGASSIAFILVSSLLVGRRSDEPTLGQAVGLLPVPFWVLVLCALAGLLVQVPAEQIAGLIEQWAPTPEAELLAHAQMLKPRDQTHAIALGVVLIGIVPLAEEIFFRGALFRALRRSGSRPWAVAAITGAAFLLSHFSPRAWPALLPVAFLLSWLRAFSGSLGPTLALHAGFNAFSVVTAFLEIGAAGEPIELALTWIVGASGALAVVLFALASWVRFADLPRRYRFLEGAQG